VEASIVGGVLAVLMAAWPAAAEEQGDATAGHKLASQFCTACHIVGAERVGSDAAPPFRVIAENPARRLSELHSWRGPMHPVLSNLAFTPGADCRHQRLPRQPARPLQARRRAARARRPDTGDSGQTIAAADRERTAGEARRADPDQTGLTSTG
jgi:hypothetical protein